MNKETITPRTPQPSKAPKDTIAPESVRAMTLEEARVLIRKVSKDHEALFRLLAK